MTKFVGPTFQAELAAAGVPSGVWQDGDGALNFGPNITADQQTTAQQVLAAHDPNAVPTLPRRASLARLLDPLSPAQRAQMIATDAARDHWQRLQAEATDVPQGCAVGTVFIGSAKVVRSAGDLGMTPDAWFKLAGF